MSFWSSFSSASKLATSALKEAQKKLDKVLDIDEDAPPSDGTGVFHFMMCNAYPVKLQLLSCISVANST